MPAAAEFEAPLDVGRDRRRGARLARVPDDDLTSLSLDLGFSSHSHFSAAFRATYGRSPSSFRQATRGR